jgi:hypothetical protein
MAYHYLDPLYLNIGLLAHLNIDDLKIFDIPDHYLQDITTALVVELPRAR